ncbi:hypothetical protein OIU13_12500 [Brevundimonas sp. BT-123]|uniref:hypothetical protein n=1 Tax=Brevundimonas sp. BT-123 TaxID=2986928 RepID=UPI0022367B37|nr:hypothetical protein [Brevundimonas sp. BT-123]MCW0047347.1 hypothetical protein [Brevundimonas sp. BT-123]
MTDDNNRQHCRLVWLSALQAFADRDVQEGRWLDKNETNPHFSLVECMCCYFDDAFLSQDDAYEKRRAAGYVSATEVAAVAEFHALAERYRSPDDDDWNARRILGDPKWQAVVQAAQTAQANLLLITDAAERKALLEPLVWESDDGVFKADLTGSTITLGVPNQDQFAGNKSSALFRRWFGWLLGR